MLYYETVDAETLGLIKQLQKTSLCSELRLVGGTALALQLGHRKSIDIDLFGIINTDINDFSELNQIFKDIKIINRSKSVSIYNISGIKVDIVNFRYAWLREPVVINEILMAHIDDIIAMKLSAITGRGSKKDFIDLFFLLQHCSLENMLDLYSRKFSDGSIFLVLKSLIYFVDAERDLMPVMLKPLNWEHVKKQITYETNKYIKKL
ncbi:MAG: nucleotidyl transferase AbiEii/AbiGii toxin family protein [Bacteroidales bacterium]|nr:nucleotidyl transferase AbiEii/AbiGii toxin family protein [Bacteroidales bacterium]